MNRLRFDLHDLFERGPERRIELIGGKAIVGGSLDGSHRAQPGIGTRPGYKIGETKAGKTLT